MPIPIVARTDWLTRVVGTGTVARELGVSTRTIGYWRTGERVPSLAHQSGLARVYDRTQYSAMRGIGLAPIPAAKYRGLYPDTFTTYFNRINDVVESIKTNRAVNYLVREGIDPMRVSKGYLDMLVDSYDAGARAAIDEFGGDVEESEQYF